VSEPTDEALVAQAVAGDYAAFERLVERHGGPLFRLAAGMTRNESDAQEVLQETFLQAFRGLAEFRSESKVSTWLTRICTNCVLMQLRRRRRKPLLSIEESPGAENQPGMWPSGSWARQPERSALDHELRDRVRQAVLGLPETQRIVVLLKDAHGFANAEIAEAIGESVATTKSRLHRGRKAVREALSDYVAVRATPGVDEEGN
jgi:RNA polymerase sigma-70 factor (ECF subfamily)